MYSPHSLTHPLVQRNNWKLRITIDALIPGSLPCSLKELCKTLHPDYLFVQETGKKTGKAHIHGGFSFNSARPDTVKTHLKKFFKFDKDIKKLTNNHWSCVPDEKPETWNRYFAYMMKEENVLETSFSKDKLDEFSQSCKEEWNRIQKEQRSVINKTARKKVTDRETHYQNIMLKLKEDEIWKPEQVYEVDKEHERSETLTCHEPNYSRRFDEVLDYVITEYEDEYFTTIQLEPIINRVMCQLYPGYWKNQMKQKLKLRLISQI